MKRIAKLILPDNGRLDFDPNGSEDMLGKFATLPLAMPQTLRVWTGRDGKPLVMWCDHARIRPSDMAYVWRAVEEFNADCDRP